jgi:hydrogenase/urease accessory protein HupE
MDKTGARHLMRLRPCARTSIWIAIPLILAAPRAQGHELEIDQLRVWIEPRGSLRGQLILDPELTRPKDAELPEAIASERVRALMAGNLAVTVDGVDCPLTFTTRELYVIGGAAPGDVVMFECDPPRAIETLRLHTGHGMPRVAVNAVGFLDTEPNSPILLLERDSELALTRRPRSTNELPRAGESWARELLRYTRLGITHIVPVGFDHVLFVLGLSLQRRSRLLSLFWELTAFTLAHSCTLALASLGWLQLSARIVEPLIALSIAVVALGGLLTRAEQTRWRVGLCFGFGLFHGLGFAGALLALHPARSALLRALFGFNLGVEVAQGLIALCTLGLLQLLSRKQRTDVVRSGSLGIAAAGLYLFVARLLT